MTTGRDKMGRPLVVVTGLGVVTSLGAGKADNWAKLTAGESGIKTITRFPTDGLKTRIAGTIDYLPPQSSNAALTESFAQLAADEAVTQSGVSGTGRFPGPLFLAVPPIEMEWPQRLEFGGLRFGRNGGSARRRSYSPRRNRCRTLYRHGRVYQPGVGYPLLAALSAVYRQ
jgi:3-oxoacyl-[acyl-carrier-protein] synthase II